MRYLRYRKH